MNQPWDVEQDQGKLQRLEERCRGLHQSQGHGNKIQDLILPVQGFLLKHFLNTEVRSCPVSLQKK